MVALAVCVLTHVLAGHGATAEIAYLLPLVGAALGAWIGAERGPSAGRQVPRLIAVGLTLSALGDVLWIVVHQLGGDTDLSVADPAWFSSYLCLAAALWLILSRSRRDGRMDLDSVVDALTIVVVTLLVFWRMSIVKIVAESDVSPLVRATWASYPVLDAILLALVVRVLLSPRARAAIDGWFVAGVLCWLGADVGYLFLDGHDAVLVLDSAWMVAPALLASAAWRRPDIGADAAGSARRQPWLSQLLVAVVPLIVPAALELTADLRGEPDAPGQLFAGTFLLIVLAFMRTGRLLRSEDRSQRELARARDDALAASDAKSMFLANMSHELRTPLTTVLAASELLEDSPLTPAQAGLVGRMQRAGQRLMTLVESLLDFSRVEAGQVTLQSVEFDVAQVLTDIVDGQTSRARSRGVEIACDLGADLPARAHGDPVRVAQVVGNLVDNAVKFTSEGWVRLAAASDPSGSVRITVSDTGIGIRPEDQESIFASFTQVDGSATRRHEGSGLGLAICKELTELMGGSISVASELGRGSTFEVLLPLASPQRVGAA